ncbi:MAG: hypothetical protein IID45_09975, partial [Planctomycetes bacterium]|nr:hypothetical protein [Planctomycetota bacterium]
LDDDDDLPATVIFYPVESDVRTAVLEPFGQMVVDQLETLRSCRLNELLAAFPAEERENVIDICRDLAETGLIALG